jgi:hypothetical protein
MALFATLAFGPTSRAQDAKEAEPEPSTRTPEPDLQIPGGDGPGAHARWEARLSAEIDRIEQVCRLTEDQKRKLQLAGRGDIKRSFDRVEDARRRLRIARKDPKQSEAIQAEVNALSGRFEEGLFRDGSMFAKTLAKVLNADQTTAYRVERRARRRFRHRARVDLVIEVFDAVAGCTDAQRERLAKLLQERTRLPIKSDDDFTVLLAQAAGLPDTELRPIFQESQWRAVSRLLKQLEPQLKDELKKAALEPDDAADPIAAREGPSASGKK